MRQSGNLDKREKSIIDSANLRKQIQAGMGGADAPVTPLTSDMLEYGERERQKVRDAQLANVSNILASRKAMEAGVDEYGRGFGTEQSKLNLPSSVTLDLKPPPAAASTVSDEMPSNAEMAGLREGLKDFTPLTSDPETAKDVDKLEIGTAQKATNTFAQLPGSEIRNKLSKEFETLATSRKARLDARKKGLDSDRWLAVANLGASILAQPGGQTFLQAIGKGAKESGIIGSLSKLNREEADIADKLETVDLDTLMKKYQLSKDEAAEFARKRTEDRATRKLEADINYNNDRVNLLKQQGKIEEAKLVDKRNKELRKMIQDVTKVPSKDQQKNITDVFKGYWREIESTPEGKQISDLLETANIDLAKQQNITHLYQQTRLIQQAEGLDQRSAYRIALNNFLRGISPAKKQ
jgi:hypothetical protein